MPGFTLDFRLSQHRLPWRIGCAARETILLRPSSSRKSRRNASTSSSLSSLLPYFSSGGVVSCPTACPGKRVGDRATPMILGQRGLVPRHKTLEKLVKGRRGGTEISRGKVERRNIRRTSGRTRLNERESCRSTGFLYFSARFCARFKRLHARATPQMSCYSKLADERLESRCIDGRSPLRTRGQNGREPRGFVATGSGEMDDETNDYDFCGRGMLSRDVRVSLCRDFSPPISPRDLADLPSIRKSFFFFKFVRIFRQAKTFHSR